MLKIYDKASAKELSKKLANRIDDALENIIETTAEILNDVKQNGDKAVKYYTKKFDNVDLDDMFMTENEINKIYNKCDKDLIKIMEKAAQNIEEYHKNQTQTIFTSN